MSTEAAILFSGMHINNCNCSLLACNPSKAPVSTIKAVWAARLLQRGAASVAADGLVVLVIYNRRPANMTEQLYMASTQIVHWRVPYK